MPWRKGASATASAPHPYQVNIWNLESRRRQTLGKSVIGLPAVGRPSLKVGSITTSVTDLILKRKNSLSLFPDHRHSVTNSLATLSHDGPWPSSTIRQNKLFFPSAATARVRSQPGEENNSSNIWLRSLRGKRGWQRVGKTGPSALRQPPAWPHHHCGVPDLKCTEWHIWGCCMMVQFCPHQF